MFSYVPDFLPNSIVLIGAGGTGSRLMPMLAQLVRTCLRQYNPNAWLERLPIYVIDGDVVEDKNLLRQNFISKDVGKNKASVLATRYSSAFGIPIYPSTKFLNESENVSFLGIDPNIFWTFQNSVVIMAVDSANARRTILKALFAGPNRLSVDNCKCFVIDAGNEDSFGQVKFFTTNPIVYHKADRRPEYLEERISSYPKQIPKEYKAHFIPIDPEYYKNLGTSTQELSCAELPQTLAINAMMATLICSVLQNFLYLKPMNFDGVRFAMNGSMSTEYNTPRRWLRRAVDYSSDMFGASYDYMKYHGHQYPSTLFETVLNETKASFKSSGLMIDKNGDAVPDPSWKPPELKKETLTTEAPKVEVSAVGTPELEVHARPVTPVPPLVPAPRRARTPRPVRNEQVEQAVLRDPNPSTVITVTATPGPDLVITTSTVVINPNAVPSTATF